jgi:hypothetical protein
MIETILRIYCIGILVYAIVRIIKEYDTVDKYCRKRFIGAGIAYSIMLIYMLHGLIFSLTVTEIDCYALMKGLK